jgi:hypothetical protein
MVDSKPPPEALEMRRNTSTQISIEQLNEIVDEDSKIYDASILLLNDQLIQQLKIPRVVSQIIYSDGLYYKMYCEGSLSRDLKQPLFRVFGLCEDPRIQVHEEELSFFEINSIFNLLMVRDVLPSNLPVKNVRTFADICKFFVFPFMLTTIVPENTNPLQKDDSSNSQGRPTKRHDSGGNSVNIQTNQSIGEQIQYRQIELWGRPPGLLNQQAPIKFLNNLCNVTLVHILGERNFRLTITSLDL